MELLKPGWSSEETRSRIGGDRIDSGDLEPCATVSLSVERRPPVTAGRRAVDCQPDSTLQSSPRAVIEDIVAFTGGVLLKFSPADGIILLDTEIPFSAVTPTDAIDNAPLIFQ
ncbi:MAG: hypothetical protein ABEJ05_03745 [Haloglomus sp.]